MPFSLSQSQYQQMLARITALENQANDMAVAIDKFITLGQLNELLTLLQAGIEALDTQVQALEDRVTAIEEEPLT